ncbi:small-conductance mechanosensitive channel MscS [Scandinavium goeteborgense]|uniref:small-conductance mechanosensitive channel MscS n=1 Tax=Scandinavium goeteborgense TaxID=1851514 RepID=UPI000F6821F0|nr:small-conductance mechanosensitive channel MscS [Scandinavium goeteborgense]QKN79844.1 small-conductance mechanosensitive channel MscS [Scandinavium goeteborgense]
MKAAHFSLIKNTTSWVVQNEHLIFQMITNILVALFLLFTGVLIARFAAGGLRKLMNARKVDQTVTQFCCTLLRYALLTFTIIAALGRMGVETSSIIAVIGAAGLAIGLALQGSLSNFAAGVLLVSLRPFKVGEFCEIGGVSGTIEEVHIFSTTLRTVDNKSVVIPNGKIISGDIVNYSRHPSRRVEINIGVSYNSDIHKVKQVITEVILPDKRLIPGSELMVRLYDMGPSSLNYIARFWVKNEDYWDIYFDMTEAIKIALDENKIGIPFPQMDVHIHRV